ncbi:oxygen-dependent coproporphyrinogen oxidase [Lewinella cohaerens]|uniref:oxygen-dependent coproporphyrinogen oxidase n=1 Tax=Lewinella cohaerens TaxID=70995 RepID=UPI00037B2F5F|nr:oxygen-dependent coproporphyrinogen oxidase [Lewinella cohaerens]
MTKEQIAHWFQSLQDCICSDLEAADGEGRFLEDQWERPGGGGGRSRVIHGKHLEKGGVNFSAVHGELSTAAAKSLHLGEGGPFFATGVSIVLHPRSPRVPIIHMNVRYFEMDNDRWWFGGGIDLTPHYVVPEDATWFHQQLKAVCDDAHPGYYPRFKTWADDYFYLKHRKETRGVGGIFFDRLGSDAELSKEELWQFVQNVGDTFAPTYIELMKRHQAETFTENESHWQRIRRGRYVEFNLVWDRGTKFGLETDGRTESILMSLPPLAGWEYNYQVEPGSKEAFTQEYLRKGIDWADETY